MPFGVVFFVVCARPGLQKTFSVFHRKGFDSPLFNMLQFGYN